MYKGYAKSVAIYWLLWMSVMLTGCIKEGTPGEVRHDHVVTLNFPSLQPYTTQTRAGGTVNADGKESAFHSAKIWIFQHSAGNDAAAVAYKYVPDAIRYTDKDGVLRVEMTLPPDIKENVDVYVLVNGGDDGFSSVTVRSALEAGIFEKPAEVLTDEGLLMSRIVKNISLEQLGTGNFKIPLERGVAKVGCYFTQSPGSTDFQVTSVVFESLSSKGTVFPDPIDALQINVRPQSPRIPQENGMSARYSDNKIANIRQSDKILLTEGNEQDYINALNNQATPSVPFYIHEAQADQVICTINYQVGTENKTASVRLENAIIRNSFVVIYGHYEGSQLNLKVTVRDWEDGGSSDINYDGTFKGTLDRTSADVRVPASDGVGEAYATVYGDNADATQRQVRFSMKMETPVGATWTANLSNTADFKLVVPTGGQATGQGGQDAVEFIVCPINPYDVDKVRTTELYITMTPLVGSSDKGEEIINNNSDHPGTTTRILIRQVTQDEWDKLNGSTTNP